MTDSTDPLIHIIPQFKELSKGLMGGINKECGRGATNENCIADYQDGKLIKRQNYNKFVDENDQVPNRFLGNNFKIEQTKGIEIGNYLQNWDILFQTINKIITQPQSGGVWPFSNTKQPQGQGQQPPEQGQQPPRQGFFDSLSNTIANVAEKTKEATNKAYKSVKSPPKKNVFITSHQHNLQNMFFKFNQSSNPKKPYGFRNCTCIKISKDQSNKKTMTVIHSENTGRDKLSYTYLEIGAELHNFLESKTFSYSDKVLDICDIYIIRHGEAMHNLVDIKNMLYKKKDITDTNITQGNREMLAKMGDSVKNGEFWHAQKGYRAARGLNDEKLNALLTTQGIEQSNNLYAKTLKSIIDSGNQNIYISSPMDRTIETLIFATSPNGQGFTFLKKQFMEMYNMRFPITASEIQEYLESNSSDTPPGSHPNPTWTDRSSESSRGSIGSIGSIGSRDSTFDRGVPQKITPWYKKVPNPFRRNPSSQGGKRKSRRKVNKKSKKRKSVKARKTKKRSRNTKKRSRNTKKRYQKGCSRK